MARKVIDEPSEDVVANARKDRAQRSGPFGRVALFLRQVVAELRKVVTPTRRELISYTGVVLIFVVNIFLRNILICLAWLILLAATDC